MTGTYSGGIKISYRDDRLVGEWNVINRLDFYGDVDQDCFGTMTFPDDRSYNLSMIFQDAYCTGMEEIVTINGKRMCALPHEYLQFRY